MSKICEILGHNYKYDGLGGGHRGEYDHTCLDCGHKTWFAGYDIVYSGIDPEIRAKQEHFMNFLLNDGVDDLTISAMYFLLKCDENDIDGVSKNAILGDAIKKLDLDCSVWELRDMLT